MEKRISFVQFQSVKSVAKAIDPYLRQEERLKAQIEGLDEEFKAKKEEELKKLEEKLETQLASKREKLKIDIQSTEEQIAAIESGIMSIVGFHVTDLVKKVIEPNDKGIKETKYLPTDIVSYDSVNKQYIITVPDNTSEKQEEIEEKQMPQETVEDSNELPFEESTEEEKVF